LEAVLAGDYDFDDEVWDEVSEEGKDMISAMLTNENERLTPKDVLNHAWMKKFSDPASDVPISNTHYDRLKDFEKSSKLKKAALSYLATRTSDKDIENEMKIFQSLDKNKDGYVTLKELKEGMQDNPNIEEITRLLNSIDTDHNGAINYTEFIAATMDTKTLM
jgi:calcium-dependent protein kinase